MRLPRLHITEYLFSETRFVRTTKLGFWLALTSLIFALVAVLITALRPIPQPPNTTEDFTRLTRVQFFAENFLTVWLTGTSADAATMRAMVTSPTIVPTTWSSDALEVSNLNTADIEAHPYKDGSTQWVITTGVTLTPPGNDQPRRNYFTTTVIDRPGTAIKALSLPRIVNLTRPNITVVNDYSHSINTSSPVGIAVSNFAAAYYTSDTGSLGRFVSSNFHAEPINGTPYTGVELTALSAHTALPQNPDAGTTLDVLATLKASISLTTFQTLNVPITLRATDRNLWVVDNLPTALWTRSDDKVMPN